MSTKAVAVAALSCLMLWISACGATAAERPSAAQLIAAYRASVEKLSRVKFECTTTRPVKPDSKRAVGVNIDETVWRDDARWKIDQTQVSFRVQTLADQEILRAQLLEPTVERPNPKAHLSAFRGNQALRIWIYLGKSSLQFGRVPGDGGQPLWDVLTSASSLEVLPEPESIDGHVTWIVESRGKYGIHRIWFDPESGGLPRRIEVRKGLGDLYQDEQIGSRPEESEPMAREKSGSIRFNRSRQSILIRYDNFELRKQGDQYVIMAFNSRNETAFEKDVRHVGEATYRVRTFERRDEPWPTDPIQFDIPIDEKRPVGVFENAPLEFGSMSATRYADWVDGKLRDRPQP